MVQQSGQRVGKGLGSSAGRRGGLAISGPGWNYQPVAFIQEELLVAERRFTAGMPAIEHEHYPSSAYDAIFNWPSLQPGDFDHRLTSLVFEYYVALMTLYAKPVLTSLQTVCYTDSHRPKPGLRLWKTL